MEVSCAVQWFNQRMTMPCNLLKIMVAVMLTLCLKNQQFAFFVEGAAKLTENAVIYNKFQDWMQRYGANYSNQNEVKKRFKIYKSNVEFIESTNAKNNSYMLTDNKFADMTNEEYRSIFLGFLNKDAVKSNESFTYVNLTDIPTARDWRTAGAVTSVKNQGTCGSCWAFSAVAAIEGITKIKTGKIYSLSEQEIVDCDTKSTNKGCNGGEMEKAFDFVRKEGGLASENGYPYLGKQSTCKKEKTKHIVAKINGYKRVPANNEKQLQAAVAGQPVSVAVDAGGLEFQLYGGGVFDGFCGTDLNHGVTAVGYGQSSRRKYWIIKNSWGTDWGESGYMRIRRGTISTKGMCGIAMMPSYPTKV